MLEDYCCLSLAKTDGKFTLVGDSAFVAFYVFSKEPLDILLEINILNCFLLEHGLVSDYSKFSACRRRKDEAQRFTVQCLIQNVVLSLEEKKLKNNYVC